MMLPNNLIVILIIKLSLLEISNGLSVHWSRSVLRKSATNNVSNSSNPFKHICVFDIKKGNIVPYNNSMESHIELNRTEIENHSLPNKWSNGTSIDLYQRNKYVCCEDYTQFDGRCIPRCQSCYKNETCLQPNCNCGQGYRKDTSGERCCCLPMCTEKNCENGVCSDSGICNKSYQKNGTYYPVCSEECTKNNGHCLEPNVCSCHRGYKKTENNSTCEPECLPTCINGHCVAPNTCRCMDDYEYDNSTSSCKLKCTCVHGTCTTPETCNCSTGYRHVNATVCEPICSEPCRNSTCVAPENCKCFEGYSPLKNSSNICEPTCEVSCGNGTCTAPGVCTCEKLFTYNNQTDPRCQSNIRLSCEDPNTKCKINNVHNNFTCFKGYHRSANMISLLERYKKEIELTNSSMTLNNSIFSSYITSHPNVSKEEDPESYFSQLFCQPTCDLPPVNSTCVAPNVYECHRGFQRKSNTTNVCSKLIPPPVCDATKYVENEKHLCNHQINTCSCKDGYKKNKDGCCVFDCHEACNNGTCTEDNRCICNDGYRLRDKPYTGKGYTDECIPECTRKCSGHGDCDIEDGYSCKCYYGWTGLDCEHPTLCSKSIGSNDSDINRISIHDSNYAIKRAYKNAPPCPRRCNALNNESLCYLLSLSSDIRKTYGCLLDFSCRNHPPQEKRPNTSDYDTIYYEKIVISVISFVMSVAAIIMIIFVYKCWRKKLATNITLSFMRLSNDQSLIPLDE